MANADRVADLVIRRAVAGDATAIAAMAEQAIRIGNAAEYSPAVIEAIVGKFNAADVAARLALRHGLVAERDGRIVGTASLGAKVHSVFVAAEVQRRGVGARLMGTIEAIAAQDQRRALVVSSSLTAVPFYRSLGFHFAGTERGDEITTVLMAKLLSAD